MAKGRNVERFHSVCFKNFVGKFYKFGPYAEKEVKRNNKVEAVRR